MSPNPATHDDLERTTPCTTSSNRPGATSSNRPGATSGNRPGATSGNRPGATSGNRPGATSGNRPGATSGNRPGATSGNRPGADRLPVSPTANVQSARDQYLAENGFSVKEYTTPTVRLKFFGRYFDLPNSPDRQWAIPLHDLHHLATGYGTDFVGEAEVGAWELGAGCRRPIVYALNAAAVLIGVTLAPGRVLAAIRAGRGARSLYRTPLSYEAALAMTVGELRVRLGVPAYGVATEPRRLHADAEARRAMTREGEVGAPGAM